MFKKIFFHGLTAGILASVAGIIYNRFYYFATEIDFSAVLNKTTIISLNVAIGMVACVINWVLTKWSKRKGEIIFNILFTLISFAMVIIPISLSLPLKIKSPELFPGLAVPMIFFPALAWFTIRPFFTTDIK